MTTIENVTPEQVEHLRLRQIAADAALVEARRMADEAGAAVVRGDRGPENPPGVIDIRNEPAARCWSACDDVADALERAVEADIAYERAVRALGAK